MRFCVIDRKGRRETSTTENTLSHKQHRTSICCKTDENCVRTRSNLLELDEARILPVEARSIHMAGDRQPISVSIGIKINQARGVVLHQSPSLWQTLGVVKQSPKTVDLRLKFGLVTPSHQQTPSVLRGDYSGCDDNAQALLSVIALLVGRNFDASNETPITLTHLFCHTLPILEDPLIRTCVPAWSCSMRWIDVPPVLPKSTQHSIHSKNYHPCQNTAQSQQKVLPTANAHICHTHGRSR